MQGGEVTMQCPDYRDLVAAHVDAQLARDEEAQAAAHVAGCARCAALLATQRALKQALRSSGLIHQTPVAVRQTVHERIEAEERAHQVGQWRTAWWSLPASRLALAAIATLLIVVGAVSLLRSRPQAPGAAVLNTIVAHYRAVESGEIELSVHTDDPMVLRTYYLQTGAFTFRNTVVDLEPLGLLLVGGTLTQLDGQASTLSVYRGRAGMVLCHRIQARGGELPPGGEVVGGDRFYTLGGITICVHFEADVICFMASAMPRADFVRLFAGHV
jgi:anti-sigma factor RsiW